MPHPPRIRRRSLAAATGRRCAAGSHEQLLVLHVPDRLFRGTDRQVRKVRDELAEPDIRRELAQPLQRVQNLSAQWARSWQEVSDGRLLTDRAADGADNLDTDQSPRSELGDPSRPGDAVVEHQQTVRPPIDPRGRHPGTGRPEPGDPPLVCTGRPPTTGTVEGATSGDRLRRTVAPNPSILASGPRVGQSKSPPRSRTSPGHARGHRLDGIGSSNSRLANDILVSSRREQGRALEVRTGLVGQGHSRTSTLPCFDQLLLRPARSGSEDPGSERKPSSADRVALRIGIGRPHTLVDDLDHGSMTSSGLPARHGDRTYHEPPPSAHRMMVLRSRPGSLRLRPPSTFEASTSYRWTSR